MNEQKKLFEAWVVDDEICIVVSDDDEEMTRSDLLFALESIKLKLMTGQLKFANFEPVKDKPKHIDVRV